MTEHQAKMIIRELSYEDLLRLHHFIEEVETLTDDEVKERLLSLG